MKLSIIVTAIMLTACGGGGGGDQLSSATQQQPTQPAPTSTVVPAPTPAPANTSSQQTATPTQGGSQTATSTPVPQVAEPQFESDVPGLLYEELGKHGCEPHMRHLIDVYGRPSRFVRHSETSITYHYDDRRESYGFSTQHPTMPCRSFGIVYQSV